MDKLSNIIAFITVAETHSFAETGRRLNIATSVVSKRIKDLEEGLGVRLLHRSTRQVNLSEAGYRYFDHARRIVSELAEVEENIRYQNENPVGLLNVTAPVSFGTKFLGPAVSGYLDKYPDVAVKMHLTDLTGDLQSGAADIAIMIGETKDMNAITRKLAESRKVVVAAPSYIKTYGAPATPRDLIRHNCLSYTHLHDGKHWPFVIAGKNFLQPVQGRFAANNGLLLLQSAIDGCGIAMLPSFIVGDAVMAGKLQVLLEEFEEPAMRISAAWLPQRQLSARARTFIDHLSGYFSGFSGA